MMDVLLAFDAETGLADLRLQDGDLALDTGLGSAVAISLFSDARAKDGPWNGLDDPKGWWAENIDNPTRRPDRFGSRLWLLRRAKTIPETRQRIESEIRDALAWMITDGIVRHIDVHTEWVESQALQAFITLALPNGGQTTNRFIFNGI